MDMESVQHTLQTGMVVKNYKEMCSLLNEKVTTGEAKQIQLRNWERFFKYKKEGHKFMITEILEKPLEKKDKRDAGNRSLFVKDIAEMIMIIARNPSLSHGGSCRSQNSWMKAIGLVNTEYGKKSDIRNARDTNPAAVSDFYDYGAGKAVKGYFTSAMKYIERTGMAEVKREYVAVDKYTLDRKMQLSYDYGKLYLANVSDDDYDAGEYLSEEDYIWMHEEDDDYDVPVHFYTVDEYNKLKKDYLEETDIDTTKRKGRYQFWNGFLKKHCWKRCYLQYQVTPRTWSDAPRVKEEDFEKMKLDLNKRVYEHVVQLTTNRYQRNCQKYEEAVKEEMKVNCMKVGKMRERFTKTYKEKSLYVKYIGLTARKELIDAMIKIEKPEKLSA